MENKKQNGYLAWILDEKSRSELLGKFPPKFDKVICHHITYKFGVDETAELPVDTHNIKVIGHESNDKVQALVVSINGHNRRPDGKLYHITVSVNTANGGKPVMSNDLLSGGYHTLEKSISIEATPAFIRI